ncbi:MAG: acyl-CoA dehydrogenase domain protein [Bradyrhizobium sp.]|nr:acyl-CoA dehydrogenase domain protein [Bradyrhizobium sp.]
MTDILILDQFERLLDKAPPAMNPDAGATRWDAELWQSGFLDLLVDEADGGAGLTLEGALPLALAQGRRLAPRPLVETMMARRLLAGRVPGDVFILLAAGRQQDHMVSAALLPARDGATHVLLATANAMFLLPFAAAEIAGSRATWHATTALAEVPPAAVDIEAAARAILAARMAGAMQTLVSMTAEYVRTRQQFGRTLSQFQAVQQHLAVMAEEALSASAAASMALAMGDRLTRVAGAAAKLRANEASATVAACAHALHGAIGMSLEHSLPHFTRALRAWRMALGGETILAETIGADLATSPQTLSGYAFGLFDAETDAEVPLDL